MATVNVQKPVEAAKLRGSDKQESDKICARLCYLYPAYKLSEARKLPSKDVRLLLDQANREQAIVFHALTHISTAPHTEKGKGVKSLIKHYEKVIKKYE